MAAADDDAGQISESKEPVHPVPRDAAQLARLLDRTRLELTRS